MGPEGGIPGEHERGAVSEPSLHFAVGAAPDEEPLPGGVGAEMLPSRGMSQGIFPEVVPMTRSRSRAAMSVTIIFPVVAVALLLAKRGGDRTAISACRPPGPCAMNHPMDAQPRNEAALQSVAEILARARAEVAKVIIGQQRVVDSSLIAIFTGNHILIEGVPGVAKTLLVRTLAKVLGADFSRIQFTPDLMPSDITGTNVFNLQEGAFHLVKGPVFTSFLLADEINRAPAKTQSALLQAMQERLVTIDGKTHALPPVSPSSRPRIRSSTRAPIRCPRPRRTASSFASRWTTRPPTRSCNWRWRRSAGALPNTSSKAARSNRS